MSENPKSKYSKEKSFLFTTDKEVAAEAGEDYAIRKVPAHWKRRPLTYAQLVFGSVTSVFAFAMGGQIALSYGMNALWIACVVGWLVGAPLTAVVAWQTANSSIDTDLLARGAGFGFLGSTASTFIYGLNWLMYAGFEAAFLGSAIYAFYDGWPLWIWYLIASAVMIPLNWYGVSQISWIQKWTVPLFFAGLIWLFYDVMTGPGGEDFVAPALSVETILPSIGIILGNLGIWILLVGDSARFARKDDRRTVVTLSLVVALGGEFLVLPPLGGYMAIKMGEMNPGTYGVTALGFWGLLWILITQTRIQESNYYSGSLSMTNVVARVFHWLPGRRFFVVVVGVVAFVLAAAGIVDHLGRVLTFMSVFLFAFVGVMVWALVIQQRELLKIGSVWLEHRRGYLRNWGWPATLGLVAGSVVGAPFALYDYPSPYGGILGIGLGFVVAPLTAAIVAAVVAREPHYLLVRMPPEEWRDTNVLSEDDLAAPELQTVCGVCGANVMMPDACQCPTDITPSGVICSACCAGHGSCKDACKKRPHDPITAAAKAGV